MIKVGLRQTTYASVRMKRYFVSKLLVETNENFESEKDPKFITEFKNEDIRILVDTYNNSENELETWVKMHVELSKSAEPQYPYKFSIKIDGFFEFAKELPKDKRGGFLSLTQPTVLFSTCREILLAAMEKGPFGAPLLPTIVFEIEPPTDKGGKKREKTSVAKRVSK